MKYGFALLTLACELAACSARRLPPGTPPPEYEPPIVAPWPASAQPDASAPPSAGASTPRGAASAAALSPDAGVR
ncbi:MAG TPA: hypothetical protein VHV51_02605 [Polyangiaceae bacterium]|nr:hypothetical protein [Polyangiaceae bacterium]